MIPQVLLFTIFWYKLQQETISCMYTCDYNWYNTNIKYNNYIQKINGQGQTVLTIQLDRRGLQLPLFLHAGKFTVREQHEKSAITQQCGNKTYKRSWRYFMDHIQGGLSHPKYYQYHQFAYMDRGPNNELLSKYHVLPFSHTRKFLHV